MTERSAGKSPRDHSSDHPVAGIVFLLVMVSALFFVARAGIQSSREAKLKTELRGAVEAGAHGDYDQAEERLRAIVQDHPNDVDALFNLGIAKLALEREDEADALFRRLLALSPKDYDAIAERGVIQKHKGNGEKALEMLESIPAGQGHIRERLIHESEWDDLQGTPRMNALREKHGLPAEEREEWNEPAATTSTAVAREKRDE